MFLGHIDMYVYDFLCLSYQLCVMLIRRNYMPKQLIIIFVFYMFWDEYCHVTTMKTNIYPWLKCMGIAAVVADWCGRIQQRYISLGCGHTTIFVVAQKQVTLLNANAVLLGQYCTLTRLNVVRMLYSLIYNDRN